MTVENLAAALQSARVYDLGQPYFTGIPHHPGHAPFLFSMTKKHGDMVTPGGTSSAAEAIAMGSHVGTHIDSLCHFSCGGKLHGGHEAAGMQDVMTGMKIHSVDHVKPVMRRGVFADIAAQQGVDALPVDFAVTPEMLEKAIETEVRPGDVVLIRTGWARYWSPDDKYIRLNEPGPELPAAKWMSGRKVFAAGSDTICFEKVPSQDMPVHVHLLVESGIYIMEALNMEELSRDRVREFVFVAVPMKLRGGTGAPVRPLAVVPE